MTAKRSRPASTVNPLSTAAITAFTSLPVTSQVALLGLLSSFAKVPIARLLATAAQRKEHAATQRYYRTSSRWTATNTATVKRLRNELDCIDARWILRKTRTGTYARTPAEERRHDDLYAAINRAEEQHRQRMDRLEAAENTRMREARDR